MKNSMLIRFFCLLISLAVLLSARMVIVRYTTPPSPVKVTEQTGEAYKPRKRKDKN